MADQGVVAALRRHAAEVEARRAVLGLDRQVDAEADDEADQEFAHLWPPGRQWAPTGTGG
jgi:hypothetical protein